jgi:hypothetical protein
MTAKGRKDSILPAFRFLQGVGFDFFDLGLRVGRGVARGRHRRALRQSAVDEHLNFDAAVLLAPRARRVVRDGLQLAVAVRGDDAAQGDVVVLDEVADDRLTRNR